MTARRLSQVGGADTAAGAQLSCRAKPQEQTVMGTTADKIAGKVGSQLRSKIIDLSGLCAVKDVFEEAQLDSEGLKKLISKGHDPWHAVYILRKDLRPC